ncbi:MAG TPA: bifunctional diaminohydroxyphosphoribosylaminopyrimidine deaminase/5-amino-6-(5-phosphoribosylamino)uracil reductase RibD [Patescibacteria group bacterium]|nr:bifunctional diaminohydroxyphosphoribosylaminopyrimidine deaminase/5-amino-6-(5-phosphoribosylamino)uracil reductase RibD [Patescibacteria group bacterium]
MSVTNKELPALTDHSFMKRAISLALRGTGNVAPNPRVGCVIVKNGRIIGEGWHERYGEAHAEVNAFKNATEDTFGSTLYVTLEPCSHKGKTPPCAPLVVEKGISEVVIGMLDPNPLVSGSGVEILQNAGIHVRTDVLKDECAWVNRFFVKNITQKMPYVILKTAQSLDGCIATMRGESKWITGDESRRRTHLLRAECDAVLIGKNTALLDNPSLTVRAVKGRNPKRIVLDSNLSLPLGLKLFTDDDRARTVIFCSEEASKSRKADTLKVAGVQLETAEIANGSIVLKDVIQKLTDNFKISSVLIEGGSGVFSSALQANLADELHVFTAPILIGNGQHAFANLSTVMLKEAKRFDVKAASKSGEDIHTILVRQESDTEIA